ncbi:hypothetical protein LTR17_020948 [Elasticomyces elasticus]|nr:hypothetical protein LTR17_020948 [Elasticomyces elasticus]
MASPAAAAAQANNLVEAQKRQAVQHLRAIDGALRQRYNFPTNDAQYTGLALNDVRAHEDLPVIAMQSIAVMGRLLNTPPVTTPDMVSRIAQHLIEKGRALLAQDPTYRSQGLDELALIKRVGSGYYHHDQRARHQAIAELEALAIRHLQDAGPNGGHVQRAAKREY